MLRAIRIRALTDAPDAFGSTLEREIARTPTEWSRWLSPGATFVLEYEGEPRGLVSGMWDAQDATVTYLMSMWVDPVIRGTGAADALVSRMLDWARAEGASTVRLVVVRENARARRLYERHGFALTGHENTRDRDGAIELTMERSSAPIAGSTQK